MCVLIIITAFLNTIKNPNNLITRVLIKMKDEIEIILPAISEDEVSTGIRKITRKLIRKGEDSPMGFLGGSDGYGVEFKNDVFEMFPYYWGDCDCGKEIGYPDGHKKTCLLNKPNFKSGNFVVTWYKYIGRGMEFNKMSEENWDKILNKCLKSI